MWALQLIHSYVQEELPISSVQVHAKSWKLSLCAEWAMVLIEGMLCPNVEHQCIDELQAVVNVGAFQSLNALFHS